MLRFDLICIWKVAVVGSANIIVYTGFYKYTGGGGIYWEFIENRELVPILISGFPTYILFILTNEYFKIIQFYLFTFSTDPVGNYGQITWYVTLYSGVHMVYIKQIHSFFLLIETAGSTLLSLMNDTNLMQLI
jgi:hypothetical protein